MYCERLAQAATVGGFDAAMLPIELSDIGGLASFAALSHFVINLHGAGLLSPDMVLSCSVSSRNGMFAMVV